MLFAMSALRYPRSRPLAIILASTILSGALLAAQSTGIHTIIHVTDPSGAPVPHAGVRLVPSPNPAERLETDEKGNLAIDLKPGEYALFVRMTGFKLASQHLDLKASAAEQTIPVRLDLLSSGPVVIVEGSKKDSLEVDALPYHSTMWFSYAELKAMPQTTLEVFNKHSKFDEIYTGPTLAAILKKMGAPLGDELRGEALSNYIVATGSDGYQAVVALAEIDPDFHTGAVIVADTMNGKPLDEHSGPLKLVISNDKRPARWVRNLMRIELKGGPSGN